MITQNGTDVFSNRQHHMFFFRTVAPDRSGINPAVAWIENNDTFAARFLAFGLLCPLLVFKGSSLAMACDIPDNVRAAKPAFSTWRREVSVFSGLKVLIRPEL